MTLYVTVILIGLFVYHVTSFPNGAPIQACGSMIPSHYGISPQTSPAPFSVELSSYTYSPGDEITVTLKSDTGKLIKGFLIQMRYANSQDIQTVRVGSFSPISNGAQVACAGGDSLTHARRLNVQTVSATWRAPDTVEDDLLIMATVLEDFTTFWVGITSNTLRFVATTTPSTTTEATTTTPPTTTPEPTTSTPTTTPTTPSTTTEPTTTTLPTSTPEPTTTTPPTTTMPPTTSATVSSAPTSTTATTSLSTKDSTGNVRRPTDPPTVDDGSGTASIFHLSHLRYSGLVLLTFCLLWF